MARPSRRKFFLCTGEAVEVDYLCKHPHSHIIGELRPVMDDERRVTALARWDVSISTCAVIPVKPEIDGYMLGDGRSWKCRYPGCERRWRWDIGRAAMLTLMSRMGLKEACLEKEKMPLDV